MGESLFLDPIRKWFASRGSKGNQGSDQLPSGDLTLEQQLAQLRGLHTAGTTVEVSENRIPNDSNIAGTGNAAFEPGPVCEQCGKTCESGSNFCPYCSAPIPQGVGRARADITGAASLDSTCSQCGQSCADGYELCPACSKLNSQAPQAENISDPIIRRVSVGNDDEDEQQASVRSVSLEEADQDEDESTNVSMASSLKNIFAGESLVNPDTVAFLERFGTIETEDLLKQLRDLHRSLR